MSKKGYRVFFDTDSLRGGNFNTALLDVIASCKDFIIVLFSGTLDRCKNPGDWVRRELACALENDKNVVPIRGRGFHFPDNLPTDIEAVRWKNGIDDSIEYFDAMIEKMLGFLESKPMDKGCRRPTVVAAAAAAFVTAAVMMYLFMFGRWPARSNGISGEEKASNSSTISAAIDETIQNDSKATQEDSRVGQNDSGIDQSYSSEYYILFESDTRYYTKEELEELNDWELWMARNELYARHGRKFSNKEVQDYFYKQPWYVGLYDPNEYDVKGRPKVYNDYEARNRATIEQIEAERNSPYMD